MIGDPLAGDMRSAPSNTVCISFTIDVTLASLHHLAPGGSHHNVYTFTDHTAAYEEPGAVACLGKKSFIFFFKENYFHKFSQDLAI